MFALKQLFPGEVIQDFGNITFTTRPKSPPWKRWALIIGKTPEGEHLFWDEAAEGSENYWSNFIDCDKEPNVRFLIDMKNLSARLIAARQVEPDEELFLNYKEYHPDNWAPY